MKSFVAVVLLVACANADVSHVVHGSEAAANTLKSEADVRPDGFSYLFETDNGIRSVANGVIKNVNAAESAAQEITGEFSYPGPDGVTYVVNYVANELGYQPQGAHLPTSPPIPEAIQRSLAYLESHPQAEVKYSAAAPRPAVAAYNAPPAFPARVVSKSNKFGRF